MVTNIHIYCITSDQNYLFFKRQIGVPQSHGLRNKNKYFYTCIYAHVERLLVIWINEKQIQDY